MKIFFILPFFTVLEKLFKMTKISFTVPFPDILVRRRAV